MPQGPEVKIASDYFNEFFSDSKKLEFEIVSEYYQDKYSDIFETVSNNLNTSNPTYTIGKNIFLNLENNQIFNFHLGMTGGWSDELIKHCHFRVFDSKNEIFFKDVRKFGKMKIITKSQFNKKYNPDYDLLNKTYNLKIHLNYLERTIKIRKSI